MSCPFHSHFRWTCTSCPLNSKPVIPFIPKHEELLNIFPPNLKNNDESPSTNEAIYKTEEEDPQAKSAVLWLFPEYTMPLFVKLLNWDVYRYGIILGLTVSAGEMTESLVKHSTSTLFSYLTPIQDDRDMLIGICDTVIKVFSDNHEVDRMMTPMFKFLDRLCSSGCVSVILEDPSCTFAEDILHHIKIEMKNCRNIYKMLDCISVLCQLIQAGGGTCNKSLAKLLICICYMDKYVRKATATKLYDALLIYGESTISPDNMDEIMTILAETNWELEVAELRPIRNRLSELMDIPPPVLVKKS